MNAAAALGLGRRFVGAIRPGGPVLDLAAGERPAYAAVAGAGFAVTACDRDTRRSQPSSPATRSAGSSRSISRMAGSWRLGGGYHGIVVTSIICTGRCCRLWRRRWRRAGC